MGELFDIRRGGHAGAHVREYVKSQKKINKRRERLYYNKKAFDAKILEAKIETLMSDDDVTKKSGIYEYLIDENEKHLSIRTFSDSMKRTVYERQKGICANAKCQKHFDISEMEADHIIPWSKGGHTTLDNCQMLCRHCNRTKSDS